MRELLASIIAVTLLSIGIAPEKTGQAMRGIAESFARGWSAPTEGGE
jgi:hypothetical protein